MTERELQNKILEILYTRYKEGKTGLLNFSEIEAMIPDLDGTSRVSDACHVLHDKKYIVCKFMLGGTGFVSQITALGSEFVEENILSQRNYKEEKSKPKTEATLSDEDGNQITTENGNPVKITIDDSGSKDLWESTSYKTQRLNNEIKDKNVPPCFGIDYITDSFLLQLDNISSKQADNVCMIGIFGEWGRGKTYFFNRLTNKISQRKDKDSVKYDIIEFNAWKYQDTPALWAYLFETIYHKACKCIKARYLLIRNIWSFLYQLILFLLPTIILVLINSLNLISITSTTPFWAVGVVGVVSFVLKFINDHTDIALSLT